MAGHHQINTPTLVVLGAKEKCLKKTFRENYFKKGTSYVYLNINRSRYYSLRSYLWQKPNKMIEGMGRAPHSSLLMLHNEIFL